MYGNDYSMVAGMQKRKLEQKDIIIENKNELIQKLKEEIIRLGGNPNPIINQFYKDEEDKPDFDVEETTKNLYENLERTIVQIRKKAKDNIDMNYLTTHLLIKAEKSKTTQELYPLIRAINNSINNCTRNTSLKLYSKILLREIVKGDGNYRTTIISSFQTIFSMITSLKDIELHKDVIANIYKELIKLYEINKGNVKRSIGIAIERCNYLNFEEIINQTDAKELYQKWSKKELYNKNKWK